MRKPQYHVSGIDLMSMCGVAFDKKYLQRLPEPRSVAMVVGSAVDRAVSANMDKMVEAGSLLPAEQVRDVARDALVKEWSDGTAIQVDGDAVAYTNGEPVVATEEDQEEGWTAAMGDAIDASVDLATYHHREVAPIIRPTHVQEKWVLDVPELDIQVAGAIDIREALQSVRDTKTSAKSPVKTKADVSLQLSMYAAAVRLREGQFPKLVQLDVMVRTPRRKDLKYVPLSSTRGEADMPHLLARIEAAAATVNSGVFTPAPIDSWKCSKKYCGFWGGCRYARRPVSVAINGMR